MAKGIAEFQIIGNVGKIQTVGSVLKINIASEYGSRNKNGDFEANPFWNTVTVFEERQIDWINANLSAGDLVRATGTIRQTSWDKDGETQYGVTLAGSISRLAKKQDSGKQEEE